MSKILLNLENDLILINFDNLLAEIESNCLNDLHQAGLIINYQLDLSNSDSRKIIYHHVIYGICEEIHRLKSVHHKVVVFPPEISSNHEFLQFCSKDDFQNVLNSLTKRLQNLLPFVIYRSEENLFGNIDITDGNIRDLLGILSRKCQIKDNKSFTYEKIKKFSDKFDLNFLSREYFESIKTKMRLH